MPPDFCDSATTCKANVVFPELSGPYISTILPFGKPPIPKATSKPSDPVDIACTSRFTPVVPNFITEPLPNAFSIWPIADSKATFLFLS